MAYQNPPYYISAYALACKQGFVGSLQDWLDSLKGEKGDTGAGVQIKGKYNTLVALQAAHPAGEVGDYYTVGATTDTQKVYYWEPLNGAWTEINIRGEKGDTGTTAYEYAQAGGYTGTEEDFEALLAGIQTYSNNAQTAAANAAESATAAAGSATAAANAKLAAETAEGNAQAYASTAASGAAAASNSATLAESAKAAAAQSSLNAASSASSAAGSAASASSSAQSAESSASDANASKTAAAGSASAAAGSASAANTSKEAASGSESNAEAWAVGKRNGTDVGASDPAYHNNSKYYKEQAATSAGNAADSAASALTSERDAEAWAVGKRNGEDVGSTDPEYHNNAKYYSEQAAASAAESNNRIYWVTGGTTTANQIDTAMAAGLYPVLKNGSLLLPLRGKEMIPVSSGGSVAYYALYSFEHITKDGYSYYRELYNDAWGNLSTSKTLATASDNTALAIRLDSVEAFIDGIGLYIGEDGGLCERDER